MTPDCSGSSSGENIAYDAMTGVCSVPETLEELTVGHVMQSEHMCVPDTTFVSVMRSCAEPDCKDTDQVCQTEPGERTNGVARCKISALKKCF